MQRSGGYLNQDSGGIDKVVSELLAALAAQEARSGLSHLARSWLVSGPAMPSHGPSRVEGYGLAVRAGCWMPYAACWPTRRGRCGSRMSMLRSRHRLASRSRRTRSVGCLPLIPRVRRRCLFGWRGVGMWWRTCGPIPSRGGRLVVVDRAGSVTEPREGRAARVSVLPVSGGDTSAIEHARHPSGCPRLRSLHGMASHHMPSTNGSMPDAYAGSEPRAALGDWRPTSSSVTAPGRTPPQRSRQGWSNAQGAHPAPLMRSWRPRSSLDAAPECSSSSTPRCFAAP
jgi:hypothetical protein